MKETGIVREVDELGRVVIPIEARRMLNIYPKNPLQVFTDADSIILRKYEVSCTLCGDENDVSLFKGKALCDKCRLELANKA